jgi:hypothetical protein
MVAALTFVGLITGTAHEDSARIAGADRPPAPRSASMPKAPPPNETPGARPLKASPVPFGSDDKGFLHSSARCRRSQSAFAIGRTPGSLVVICGERAGRYEYLGVRLSDAAVLRTDAETDSARGFLAQTAGVVYAVSATELKVTAGGTVIKQEPMLEYREVLR